MAKNTLETQKAEELKKEAAHILDKRTPPFFKVGRYASLQLAKVERDLFTDMEEKESGNYIINGLNKQITELDFTAFTFAIGQILYNQSYKSGNEDINSGLIRDKNKALSRQVGEDLYNGSISVTLNELCRLAYGKAPTSELKKKMDTLIDTVDKASVVIKFPNGDELESKLCVKLDKYTREKDKAISYNLYLNPIFGSQIQKQFGELPQEVIADIETACKKKNQRKQTEHYLLLRWLSVQDKRYAHKLTIDVVIRELRMETYYKKDKTKAEKQILSICETMEDIGILDHYETEYKGKRIVSITFYLNQNYIRNKQNNPVIETEWKTMLP